MSSSEQHITQRFEEFGERLSAGIQESVLRRLDARLGRPTDTSAVDDLATRYESLGDEISARVLKALEERGIGD